MLARGLAILGLAVPAIGQVVRLGAVGDSLCDEYAEESYGSYARNWTMLLVEERGVSMGLTAAQAGQAGGTWGEPRRRFYESNWARYGAETGDLIADGQHTGLAAQVGAQGVSHAVLWVGANDFSSVTLFGPYWSIYNNLWSQTQITNYINGRVANVRTTLETLAPTGVRLVIVTVPDFGITPLTWQLYTNGTNRERVAAAIGQYGQRLRELAQEFDCVLVDQYALGRIAWGTNTAPNQTLLLGNVAIRLRESDTSSHGNPLGAFVHDGVHPNTTMQGVIASLIVLALNEGYGAGLAGLSEEEILDAAGIAYGGSDTLEAAVGPLSQYVHNFACFAHWVRCTAGASLNVAEFSCFLQQVADGNSYANCDGSTVAPALNVADFTCFLQRFAAGCP